MILKIYNYFVGHAILEKMINKVIVVFCVTCGKILGICSHPKYGYIATALTRNVLGC